MNVELITMEPDQARVKLDAYRQQLRRRADAEYEAAEAGYKALAKGKALINLPEAIQSGGLGADGRPKLAVARADQREVMVVCSDHRVNFRTDYRHERAFRQSNFRVPFEAAKWTTGNGYALVPMVPADVRPNVDMTKCVILWEVIEWASHSHLVRPDRDPYLLRQIAGDLYAVLAEWDLTELERAIMGARVPHDMRTHRPHHYTLVDGEPVPVKVWNDDGSMDQAALIEWGRWYEHADRCIALTRVGLFVQVSTVFLGLDHTLSLDGPPVLFETMVFWSSESGERERYSTLDQAQAGHERMVARVRALGWVTWLPSWLAGRLGFIERVRR